MSELVEVFRDAALPQKAVFVLLLSSILMAFALTAVELGRGVGPGKAAAFNSQLRLAGPMLGLLTGSMNAFHMMDTTLRVPFSPTAKALAPGVMEIAALVGLGAASGIVAIVLSIALRTRAGPAPAT